MGQKIYSSKEEVAKFLKIFKSCWDGSVVPRIDPKNEDALIILGFTPRHRMEEIKRLCIEDYFDGPSPDYYYPTKELWEFGRHIKRHDIYIKISIVMKNGSYIGRCMSFHVAEFKIFYPYK